MTKLKALHFKQTRWKRIRNKEPKYIISGRSLFPQISPSFSVKSAGEIIIRSLSPGVQLSPHFPHWRVLGSREDTETLKGRIRNLRETRPWLIDVAVSAAEYIFIFNGATRGRTQAKCALLPIHNWCVTFTTQSSGRVDFVKGYATDSRFKWRHSAAQVHSLSLSRFNSQWI